ncbi:hypothetical protein NT239_13415 [Chitinibacter sp. SCUT-21]|uniref:hypothetical protein n=1 Tax=Chitinibacter sp. SCUT-21 TaxID=2970891 RepID=UPI0035A5AA78
MKTERKLRFVFLRLKKVFDMSFPHFLVIMFLVLSCGDIARTVFAQPDLHAPPTKGLLVFFYLTTFPCSIGVFLFPIYGFFILPWWQPIAGFFIASILVNVVTRPLVSGKRALYVWSSALGLTASTFFGYSLTL